MLLKMVKNALKTMIKYCQNMGLSVGGLICGGAYLMTSVSVSSTWAYLWGSLSAGGLICGTLRYLLCYAFYYPLIVIFYVMFKYSFGKIVVLYLMFKGIYRRGCF